MPNESTPRIVSRRSLLGAVGSGALIGTAGCTTLGGGTDQNTDGDETYANPVYEPAAADPTVLRVDGTCYVFASNQARDVDANELLNPIYASENLIDWEFVGEAFDEKPDWRNGHLWAPDIAEHDGQYYLYYSYSVWGDENPGIGVATSSTIEGPYTDRGKLFLSDEIGVSNSIDPYFHVEDGTPYLLWGSFHGIYGIKLTSDGRNWRDESPFQIAGRAFEAPYLVKRDGYYYLFVSSGACCDGHDSTYQIEVGRSESLVGPYFHQNGTDLRFIDEWGATQNPILSGTNDRRFVGPGHNAVITDDADDDWLLYHAYDTTEPESLADGALRRSLMLDRIGWEDGWPTVNDGTPSEEHPIPTVD